MSTVSVIAKQGVRVPMENVRGAFFSDKEAVTVARTRYVERRLKDGDLIEAPEQGTATTASEPAAPTQAGAGAAVAAQSPPVPAPAKAAPAVTTAAPAASKAES